MARVLLRDVPVLKAPQSGSIDSKIASSASDGAYTIVLKLTDSQAHKLFLVSAGNEDHEWWLDLRAPADATDSPEGLTTIPSRRSRRAAGEPARPGEPAREWR